METDTKIHFLHHPITPAGVGYLGSKMKILKPKDEKVIDGSGKAVLAGMLYYMNRRASKALARSGTKMPDRYALLIQTADKILKDKKDGWNWNSKAQAHNVVFAVAVMATLDNAYGTFLDELIRKYKENLKKAGLP
jgi:hypothetical protein